MTFLEKTHFHFIGIGGIGTSALAQILHEQGKIISGSDCCASDLTKSLKLSGIKVFIPHQASAITQKHQVIIYSPAIPSENVELKRAKELKIPCLTYPEALGELTKSYFTIAITGTHGKSTTTALTSLIAIAGKLDPTVVIGTKLREFKNKNYRHGRSPLLIIEACEYKRSFLHFQPKILIITNIEADHLDYYKDLKDYKKAFSQIIAKVPKEGTIIINSDDKNSLELTKKTAAKLIIVEANKNLQPGIPGDFNLKNASQAAQVGEILEVPSKQIENAIKKYTGSWRRMEYKRTKLGKVKFIDDYGHHPTEVRVTLAAIREKHPSAKILCVFQPHQHSRTRLLLKEFGTAFSAVDQVIIPNIYRARDTEEEVKNTTTDNLVAEIHQHQPNVKNGQGLTKTAEYIKKNHAKHDIIITMGAGDINSIYKLL